MLIFKSYSDYGHGWLAVKRKLLIEFNLLDKITNCSYQTPSGETVYLEEDCDATLFIETVRARGLVYQIKSTFHFKASRIRNLPRFNKG